jgi:ABC-type branched-subunit amino acid transport system substrate-binding protein
MFPKIRIIAIVLILLIGCNKPTDKNQISIGAIASLSGAAGEQGKNWVQGAELAIHQANSNGANDKTFALIVEDDQTQPAKVVAAMSKLAQVNQVVGVIGGTWDFLGEAAYPLAEKFKIPFITPSNPVEVISSAAKSSGYVFSTGMSLAAMKNALSDFIDSENIKGRFTGNIAIVFPDLPFGTRQAEMVREVIKEKKLLLSFEYAFPPASLMSDTVKLAAQKILTEKPDLTYMVIDYNGLDLVTKEFTAQKIQPKVMTTQHLDQAFSFSKDPSRYKNIFALYPLAPSLGFEEAYQDYFKTPPRVYGYEGYLAANFLINVAKGVYTLPKDTQQLLSDGQMESKARIMTTDSGQFLPY